MNDAQKTSLRKCFRSGSTHDSPARPLKSTVAKFIRSTLAKQFWHVHALNNDRRVNAVADLLTISGETSFDSSCLDLNQRILRQLCHCHCCSCRWILGKERGVDFVHRTEIAHVRKEDVAPHNFVHT